MSKTQTPNLEQILDEFKEILRPRVALSPEQAQLQIKKSSALDRPEQDSIIFIEDLKKIEDVAKVQPQVLVLPEKCPEEVLSKFAQTSCILLSPSPKLAMALVNKVYFSKSRIEDHFSFSKDQDVHPTAIIHPSVELGKDVKVGPYCIIGPQSKIGEGVQLASHVVIEGECQIGAYSQIHSHVSLAWKSHLGEACVIQSQCTIGADGFGYATDNKGAHHGIPHQGRVVLGKNVHIGAGSQIDRGTYGDTFIGDETKIDNLVHIAHNCKIGRSCLLTAGFKIAGSSEVGDFFVCGGETLVTGHVKVTDHVQLAGKSVVHKNVDKAGKYGGYPLVPINEHFKNTASLGKIAQVRKDVDKILRHLDLK